MGEQKKSHNKAIGTYRLDDQIGFVLRKVSQRHSAIYTDMMVDRLTTTRFATLAKLYEKGPLTQNELGRQTAMDAATIKGVVDRLQLRELVKINRDPGDGRKRVIELTDKSLALMESIIPLGIEITKKTLAPLDDKEQAELLRLLSKMC